MTPRYIPGGGGGIMPGLLWLYLLGFGFMALSLEPGFLDFDNLPDTNFSCVGKVIGGYYADLETNCQMFHVCTIGQLEEPMDIRFLCLNGTVFDQETRVCERIDEVDCSKSEQFYSLNLELYGNTQSAILEESPDAQETEQPLIIKSTPSTTTTTTTSTTTKRPPSKPSRPPYFTTTTATLTTSNPQVISSHHFPVNSPDIRFNPEEINISLNPGAPPNIRTKPLSFQSQSFSDSSRVIVTTHNAVYKENDNINNNNKVQSSSTTNNPKSLLYSVNNNHNNRNNIPQTATNSDINNFGFSFNKETDTEPSPGQYHYETNLGGYRHRQNFPQSINRPGFYLHTTAKQHSYQQQENKSPTTLRTLIYHHTPQHHQPHHYIPPRTEKPPQRVQIPLPLLPTLPPLTFSSPAPFTLQRHFETKRYTKDHQAPPRIIISASASVSDDSGRRLNYSLGTIGAAQILDVPPATYDEYKDSDVGLDPFYHDVPKIKQRKRRSADEITKNSDLPNNPFDIIKSEKEARDVLRFLVHWYKSHQATATFAPITIPVHPEVITEINHKLAPNVETPLLTESSEIHFTNSKEVTTQKMNNFEDSELFKKDSKFNILGSYKNVNQKAEDKEKPALEKEYSGTDSNNEGTKNQTYNEETPNTVNKNDPVLTTTQQNNDRNIYDIATNEENHALDEEYYYTDSDHDRTTNAKDIIGNEKPLDENQKYIEEKSKSADKNETIVATTQPTNDKVTQSNVNDFDDYVDDNYEPIVYKQNEKPNYYKEDAEKYFVSPETTSENSLVGSKDFKTNSLTVKSHNTENEDNQNEKPSSDINKEHLASPETTSEISYNKKNIDVYLKETNTSQTHIENLYKQKHNQSQNSDQKLANEPIFYTEINVLSEVNESLSPPRDITPEIAQKSTTSTTTKDSVIELHYDEITASTTSSTTEKPRKRTRGRVRYHPFNEDTESENIKQKSNSEQKTAQNENHNLNKNSNLYHKTLSSEMVSRLLENNDQPQKTTRRSRKRGRGRNRVVNSNHQEESNILERSRLSVDVEHILTSTTESSQYTLKEKTNVENLEGELTTYSVTETTKNHVSNSTSPESTLEITTLTTEILSHNNNNISKETHNNSKLLDSEMQSSVEKHDSVTLQDLTVMPTDITAVTAVTAPENNFFTHDETLGYKLEELQKDAEKELNHLKYFGLQKNKLNYVDVISETTTEKPKPILILEEDSTKIDTTTAAITTTKTTPNEPFVLSLGQGSNSSNSNSLSSISNNDNEGQNTTKENSDKEVEPLFYRRRGTTLEKKSNINKYSVTFNEETTDDVGNAMKWPEDHYSFNERDNSKYNSPKEHSTDMDDRFNQPTFMSLLGMDKETTLSGDKDDMTPWHDSDNNDDDNHHDTQENNSSYDDDDKKFFSEMFEHLTESDKTNSHEYDHHTWPVMPPRMFEPMTGLDDDTIFDKFTDFHTDSFTEPTTVRPKTTIPTTTSTTTEKTTTKRRRGKKKFTEENKTTVDKEQIVDVILTTGSPVTETSVYNIDLNIADHLTKLTDFNTQRSNLYKLSTPSSNFEKGSRVDELKINKHTATTQRDSEDTVPYNSEIDTNTRTTLIKEDTTFSLQDDVVSSTTSSYDSSVHTLDKTITSPVLSETSTLTTKKSQNMEDESGFRNTATVEITTVPGFTKLDQKQTKTNYYVDSTTETVPPTSKLVEATTTALPTTMLLAENLPDLIKEIEISTKSVVENKTSQKYPTTVLTESSTKPQHSTVTEQNTATMSTIEENGVTKSLATETTQLISSTTTTTPKPDWRTRPTRRTRPTKRKPERQRNFGRHRFRTEVATPKSEVQKHNLEHEVVEALEKHFSFSKDRKSFEAVSTVSPLAKSANPTQSQHNIKSSGHTTPAYGAKTVGNRPYVFNCFGRDINKFYADPRDCRLFHYCTQGYSRNQLLDMKFVCDLETYFDDEKLICSKVKPSRCV